MRAHAFRSEELTFEREERRPRAFKARRRGFRIIAGAGLSVVFGIFLFAATHAPDPARTAGIGAAAAVPPPPVWKDIVHPIQLFSLASARFTKSAFLYEARRNRIGGGREDILTFGQLNGPGPYLRLLLYRVGAEAASDAPLYVDLVRAAAQADLSIGRSLTPSALRTSFGIFETLDVDLAGDSTAAVPCLGFRGAGLSGKFRISGFACGTQPQPISRPALACLIDRLDLNQAGDDKALAAFFAAGELKRDPACRGTGLAPTAARASWLDQNDARPPLKRKKPL